MITEYVTRKRHTLKLGRLPRREIDKFTADNEPPTPPMKTVEAWEADRNVPSGPVQRLLSLIIKDDQILEKNHIVLMK